MSTTADSSQTQTAPIPTVKPMLMTAPVGGGSYAKSAIVAQQNNVAKQSAMLQTTGGKKRRQKRGGAAQVVELPKMLTVPSPVTGSMTAQALSNQTIVNGMSNQQSAAYDQCIGQGPACTAAVQASQAQSGGKRRSVRWGCMSKFGWMSKKMRGGSKKRTKKSRKSKKSRKHRKSRNHMKSRK